MKVWLPTIRASSGADVFAMRMAEGLQRQGVDATISWFPHYAEFFPDALRVARVPAGTDIIHANAAYAFAFKRSGLPLVATELHYVLDPAYRPFKSKAQAIYHAAVVGRYLGRSYRCADAITAISAFTAQVLREKAGVQVTRTIPLWVDPARFAPAARKRDANAPFRLLFVGNASRRKGADIIAPLARRLGSGFEIFCTAGLRHGSHDEFPANTRLLGRLDLAQLVDHYQQCDAVLVPSRYEGFGYAALEGMSCAKPIVGFASGAIAEVVGPVGRPWLVDVDDISALESACRRLAAEQDLARSLGEAGRSRALSVYDESAAIQAQIEVYGSLLANSGI